MLKMISLTKQTNKQTKKNKIRNFLTSDIFPEWQNAALSCNAFNRHGFLQRTQEHFFFIKHPCG